MKGNSPQAIVKHVKKNKGQMRRKKKQKTTMAKNQAHANVPLDGMSNFERLMSGKDKGKQAAKGKKKKSKPTAASAVREGASSQQTQTNMRKKHSASAKELRHARAMATAAAPAITNAVERRATANNRRTEQRKPEQRQDTRAHQASISKKRAGSAYENALISRVLAKVNDNEQTRWFEEDNNDEKEEEEEEEEQCRAATDTGAGPERKRAKVTAMTTSSTTTSTTTTTTAVTSTTASGTGTALSDPDANTSSTCRTTTTTSGSAAGKLAGLKGSAKVTKLLAIDCEMVGVGKQGLRSTLARCSIVNGYGEVIIDTYVKPAVRVIDYRTHVSGIRPHHLTDAPTHSTVRERVAALVKNRILVGHAIMNDLKVLRLFHPRHLIRDTSLFKPFQAHAGGKKPALRKLAKNILGVELQTGEHDSVEDAKAALRLYKHVKADWESGITFGKNAKIAPAPAATGNGAQQQVNSGKHEEQKHNDSDEKDDITMLYQDSEMVDTLAVDKGAQGDDADDLQVGFSTKDGYVVRKYSNKHQNWRYIQKQRKRGLI